MKLPQLQARPQRAERPSLATPSPTDFGLGAVARDMAEVEAEVEETRAIEEEVQREQDRTTVEPILRRIQTGVEERFATAAANWDGESPDFARGVMAYVPEAAQADLEAAHLTPGERDALQRGVTQYQEAVGQRAIQLQAQRRGQIAAEAASAREAVETGAFMSRYVAGMGTARAELDATYDGSQPDYAGRVLALHDEQAQAVIEAAPEALRPRLTQQMAATRLQVQAQAIDTEARGEAGYVANQVRTAGNGLLNAVISAPSMYETALTQVDQITAGLPAAQRAEARAGLTDGLTEAYIDGLIQQDQSDTALTLLNGGTLDARLTPQTKARLLSRATTASERLDVDDYLAMMAQDGAMQDNVASILTTGEAVDGAPDIAAVAASQGPQAAAAYARRIEEARGLHAATAGYAQMTPEQINAQVEGLRPEPGQAGFAEAQERYEAAQRAATAEIRSRADGAAWGLAQAPTLEPQARAMLAGDRTAAAAYAVGQETLQAQAGIPERDRRILTKPMASQLTAEMETPDSRERGLARVAGLLAAHEPPPGSTGQTITDAHRRQTRVVNELAAAGADPWDIAAATDLAGDPVRMGRYLAATRDRTLQEMPKPDRDRLEALVDGELADYLRSFEALPGSPVLVGGRKEMAYRLAAQHLAANGGSQRDAARAAAEVVEGGYVINGRQGWRMPAQLARGEQTRRGDGRTTERITNERLAQIGAARTLASYTANDGALLLTPPDNGRGLTAAQRRERYADTVTQSGRWVTTPDDNGLVLMHRDLNGGWTYARDASGGIIARSWSQLGEAGWGESRGGRAQTPSASRGVPRGVRNNNPGNIEARAGTRWQGQTGSDGRFATFATPEQGLRALAVDIGSKNARGLNTVNEILHVYAPSGENDTRAYVQAVSRQMGVQPHQELNLNDPAVRAALMGAIIQHENGQQPYGQPLLLNAARLAIGRGR